jgi:hypothetical protein
VETPQQKWRKKNLEHIREYERNRYKTRPEIRDSKKNTNLKIKYGLTLEEFNSLLESQSFGCAICRVELTGGKDTHIDHCHETKRIRGLLCNSCNNGIGRFKDSPKLLKCAITYLSYNGQDNSRQNSC